MNKIKVSADTVLAILKGIMDDEDINYIIKDSSAPKEWQGKKVQDVLNVEYYTFRHRPVDTEQLVVELLKQGKDADSFYALQRAFCILSLNSTERVFSKENDIVTVSASLEYWIQTEKVKLLEDLFEDIIVESTGVRIPVKVGSEDRQVLLAIGKLTISELEETTEFGEMSVCDLDIDLVFYPPAITREDYKAEFAMTDSEEKSKWVNLPFSSIVFNSVMNQQTVPRFRKPQNIGSINLSRVKSISMTFDGYENEFIENLTDCSFISDINENGEEIINQNDNNKKLLLRLTRKGKPYLYDCIIKEHTVTVQEDTGNETHSLVLSTRGMNNVAT